MTKARGKYSFLSMEERQQILKIFKSDESIGVKNDIAEIAKRFKVSCSTIRRLRIMHNSYEKRIEAKKEYDLQCKRFRNPKNPIVEDILYEWFKQKRIDGQPISLALLQEKALVINKEVNGDPDFKASLGWFSNFKNRFGLRSCTSSGEKLSADVESSIEFIDFLAKEIRDKNFDLSQIYNADETGLYWRVLPKTSFVADFEKDVSGCKVSKSRVTLMVCANADGSHKIPLFVIGKSNVPRCFKNVSHLPVQYVGQKSAWMTRELFKTWFSKVFLPSVRKFQADKGMGPSKVLLILDNAKCHLTKEEMELIDDTCTIQFLPPNVTSLIQPMDQGVIEKIKRLYRKSLLREMVLAADERSILEFVKKIDMLNCCIVAASAWSEVTATNISRAWRKLIPACDIESTKSSDLSEDDIIQILYRMPVFNNITPNQVSEWLAIDEEDPGYNSTNLHQIIQEFQGIQIPNETSQEQEDEVGSEQEEEMDIEECEEGMIAENIVTEANAAFDGFKVFRKWYQRQWDCDAETLMKLQQLNESTKMIIDHLNQCHLINNNT